MYRLKKILTTTTSLVVMAVIGFCLILWLCLQSDRSVLTWLMVVLIAALVTWDGVLLWRRWRNVLASDAIGRLLGGQGPNRTTFPADRAEVAALRARMQEAVRTLKDSRLGERSGRAALYELPWCMVIGNPGVGKSTAIVQSGLKFPFADGAGSVIKGIGGTRNCDWFFTSEGVLIDTAGRYSVEDADRGEWLAFLSSLRRSRPRAPINGIIIVASLSDLVGGSDAEFPIKLAKKLRQRVEELTENLEVFAPVYVIFTKADLIAGFAEFFADSENAERNRIWGATLPFEPTRSSDAADAFAERFDELCVSLQDMSATQIAIHHRAAPGFLALPLEFAALKPALQLFIATLFEENPFQFKPVFRGFYFTSAVQERQEMSRVTADIAKGFGMAYEGGNDPETPSQGFFLLDLFRKVIFADRHLVSRYTSRTKSSRRIGAFAAGLVLFAVVLGLWSWSYINNREFVKNVQADLDRARQLQTGQSDLRSRFAALDVLEDRLEQLQIYREDHPLSLSFGLYQGNKIEKQLRSEFYEGVQDIMLAPVVQSLEGYLEQVNAAPDKLVMDIKTDTQATTGKQQYENSSPTSVEDAYNALKAYLMLSDQSNLEVGHLNDQITRFWRTWLESNRGVMSREEMIRSAERTLTFFLAQAGDPLLPKVKTQRALVESSREALRRAMLGVPARERVYAEIMARASTRVAPVTVAKIIGENNRSIVYGGYPLPGQYTKEAWEQYVSGAIRAAATNELESKDWVLQSTLRDDLTLQGSPEAIQKALLDLYTKDYIRAWQRFLANTAVAEFQDFDTAAATMARLGDAEASPISKLLREVHRQTSWDNPSLADQGVKAARKGLGAWFDRVVLRREQTGLSSGLGAGGSRLNGVIGREFVYVARLVARDKDASLLQEYNASLAKVHARLNGMRNQGEIGPGARSLLQQTIEGKGSELAESLKLVDEQMLANVDDKQRALVRPLLAGPVLSAYRVLITPAEAEINRAWTAQVYSVFQRTLAGRYPFTPSSRVEASATDIAGVFGPTGSIAKFAETALGPLALRRGDTLSMRTWADLGVRVSPAFLEGFPLWVAPLDAAVAPAEQTRFEVRPEPASGMSEYTITIDGQQLRYRNTAPQWAAFVWPNKQGQPGVMIEALTFDGRKIAVVNYPGPEGLRRFLADAKREKRPGGVFDLSWTGGGATVVMGLRILSNSSTNTPGMNNANTLANAELPDAIAGSQFSPRAIPVTGQEGK